MLQRPGLCLRCSQTLISQTVLNRTPLLLQYNFCVNDVPHLGMPSEGDLIFTDGNNISSPAYKKNNHQVSSSESEEGTLAVVPLVSVGEHILMDQ